jgi:uracil-DNA glycosylase
MNLVCHKGAKHGLSFRSEHIAPEEYIEGNPRADILIVGLNPKGELGKVEGRTKSDFENFDPDCHPYFADFRKVSEVLYQNWKSRNSLVAHTDLVKCFSHSFPPKTLERQRGNAKNEIVGNCVGYLKRQIEVIKPKVIVCNGSTVCWEMLRLFPPQLESYDPKTLTSYQASHKVAGLSHDFWVVLSGFIGRIDDRNKRRLGVEIEGILRGWVE